MTRRADLDALFRRGAAVACRRMAVELGGLKNLAAAMGVSVSQAQRYACADAPDLPTLAQIAAATAEGAHSAAEFLADIAGGRFEPGRGAAAGPALDALFVAHGEAAEFILAAGQAGADGRIDAADAAGLERALGQLREATQALRAALGATR